MAYVSKNSEFRDVNSLTIQLYDSSTNEYQYHNIKASWIPESDDNLNLSIGQLSTKLYLQSAVIDPQDEKELQKEYNINSLDKVEKEEV